MNTPEFDFQERPCAACGSESRHHVGWRGGSAHHDRRGVRTEIVRCDSCGHLYPHPMPFPRKGLSGLYTDTAEYFSEHDVERKKQHGLEVMRIIEGNLQYRGTFLDVGCGRGELLWAAREAGWAWEGVDPSQEYLAWGRANLGIAGRLGTIEETHFPDAHFDAIVMGGVIEHIYDPYATLKEIRRVLKPGGVFYFDAPNENGFYTRIGNLYFRLRRRDWVVNLAPTFPPYHVQGFNPVSLRHLLSRVGFQVTALDITGTISPLTGKTSLRKDLEYKAARLINFIGNRCGAGIYMSVWAKKPE